MSAHCEFVKLKWREIGEAGAFCVAPYLLDRVELGGVGWQQFSPDAMPVARLSQPLTGCPMCAPSRSHTRTTG